MAKVVRPVLVLLMALFKRGAVAAALVTAALVTGLAVSSAEASDYAHSCRSSDGRYEMNDDALSRADQSDGRPIPYTTLSETVLSERRGYCLAQGKRFEFEARSYVRRVRFSSEGGTFEVDMLCELAADGLPAAYSCEREVVTFQRGGSGENPARAPAAGVTHWDHNGSRMALHSAGSARRFLYVKPRPGMVRAGAKPGDAVFEGEREGQIYRGTAFIFSPRCGRLPYAVTGSVAAGERRVVLEGRAPRLDDRCRVVGQRADTLVFDLLPEQ
jgi:hypothetical protein